MKTLSKTILHFTLTIAWQTACLLQFNPRNIFMIAAGNNYELMSALV